MANEDAQNLLVSDIVKEEYTFSDEEIFKDENDMSDDSDKTIKFTEPPSTSRIENFFLNCNVCRKMFKNLSDLRDHENHCHHAEGESSTKRMREEESVLDTTRYLQQRGERNEDEMKSQELVSPKNLSLIFPPRPDDGSFECALCTAVFWKTDNFERHMKWCHSVEPDIQGIQVNESAIKPKELEQELPIQVIQVHKCDICGTDFPDKETRIRHIKEIHFGIKPPMTTNEQKIVNNVETTGSSEKFQCSKCMEVFNQKEDLSTHMKIHISKETMKKCPKCDRKYRWKENLLRHIGGKHTELLTAKCRYCEKGFLTERGVLQHIKIKHRDESDVKEPQMHIQCTVCSKLIISKRQMRKHLEIHNPNR